MYETKIIIFLHFILYYYSYKKNKINKDHAIEWPSKLQTSQHIEVVTQKHHLCPFTLIFIF